MVLVGAGFSAGTGEAGIAADPAAGFEPMIGSDPGRFGRDGIVSPVTDAPWSLDLGDAVTIDDAALVDDLWVVARFTINAS